MRKHEKYMEANPEVKAWLQNRQFNTQKAFASHPERFCKAVNMTPEEWRHLDKFEARDLAWKYVQPKIAENPTVAAMALRALKSWYRARASGSWSFMGASMDSSTYLSFGFWLALIAAIIAFISLLKHPMAPIAAPPTTES